MMRVLVTGASSGIGLAIARQAAAAGRQVLGVGRRAPSQVDMGEASWEYVSVDITDGAALRHTLDRFLADGPLDALVNNAGVMQHENAHHTTAESLERHIHVNLVAAIRLTSWVLDDWVERERPGTIVNVSSVAGLKPTPKLAVYGAAKAGLIHYTKAIAAEYAGRGIRANVVCPGAVKTGLTSPVMFRVLERGVPLGGLQPVDDISNMVAYLLSDRAANMTGAVLSVDGGMGL